MFRRLTTFIKHVSSKETNIRDEPKKRQNRPKTKVAEKHGNKDNDTETVNKLQEDARRANSNYEAREGRKTFPENK